MSISDFYRWIRLGKSAKRAFLNITVQEKVIIRGVTLHIGGRKKQSYHEILLGEKTINFIKMDILRGQEVSILGDLVQAPFKDRSLDTILCFNVMEHIYDFERGFQELYRILNLNGIVYGYIPFICQVHSDPNDYWRFTDACLKKILEESRLSLLHIEPHGGLFLSCFDLLPIPRILSFLRPILVTPFLFADILAKEYNPGFEINYPLGYFFVAQKFV
jgi:SAM-dependent methyltransferase